MGELLEYPTDPAPAVTKVVNHLRKVEKVPTEELLHCGWHLQGVALHYAKGTPAAPPIDPTNPPAAAPMTAPVDDVGRADVLERAFSVKSGPAGAQSGALSGVPWPLVLSVLQTILQKFLENRAAAPA